MGINTTMLRLKTRAKSLYSKGKAYVLTSKRKAALKAAQLASAAKRKGRNAVASVGGNTKLLRAKVGVKRAVSKAKATVTAGKIAAKKVPGMAKKAAGKAARNAVASVGGNTKLLRAKVAARKAIKNSINKSVVAARKKTLNTDKLRNSVNVKRVESAKKASALRVKTAKKQVQKAYKNDVATRGARAVHLGLSKRGIRKSVQKYLK